MTIPRLRVLAALDSSRLTTIVQRLSIERHHGRPWSRTLVKRVLLTRIAVRTNLTFRELAVLVGTTKSTAHRIVAALGVDRRRHVGADARPHRRCALQNYRCSCNAQVLVRRRDLRVIASSAGGPGNRNDTVHYRGSAVDHLSIQHGRVVADGGYRGVPELISPVFRGNRIVRDRRWRHHRRRRARVEHAIARLKDWRVLRDHRRRGTRRPTTSGAARLPAQPTRTRWGSSPRAFAIRRLRKIHSNRSKRFDRCA